MREPTVNLIEDREATVALLADPLGWRVRTVEEITVDSATSCRRRRSLQIAPLRDQLASHLPDDSNITSALLALPVAPMPRGPLLDFDVRGPKGDAWLLPRVEIAARQAIYLEHLAGACDIEFGQDLRDLLTAILGFTGELFRSEMRLGTETPHATKSYLEDGFGRTVADPYLDAWRRVGDKCREILRPRLDVFKGYSAPEEPALLLPELYANGIVVDDDHATDCLTQYSHLLTELNVRAADGVEVAQEFLTALADYANSYDLIVALHVPLDEPFLVKFAERRDLQLSVFSNSAEQELVVADAQTNHVTFKVVDPNVRICSFYALKPGSDEYSYGAFQSRTDQQNRAFYAHDPDRDYRIRLSFRLALLRRLQLVPYFTTGLLALLMTALLIKHPHDLRTLAIVVGPAALAASVLLFREPSTLGSRLRLLSSVILAVALTVLVLVALALYVA